LDTRWNEERLARLVWVVAGLLVAAIVGFGVFYYRDRYVRDYQPLAERQVAQMEDLVRRDPQNAHLRVAVAQNYLDQGYVDRALKQAQEALKIDDQLESAYITQGVIYLRKGNLTEAETSFRKVVELNEGFAYAQLNHQLQFAHYQLGQIASQRNDYSVAIDEYRKALAIQASDADARFGLGLAYQKLGQHDEAIKEFSEAVRYVPDFTEVYAALATSYEAKGMEQAARYAQAMIVFVNGDYARAANELAEVVKRQPELAGAQLGLGLSYEQLGQRDAAIAAFKKVLELRPGDVSAIQGLGRLGVEP